MLKLLSLQMGKFDVNMFINTKYYTIIQNTKILYIILLLKKNIDV